MTNELARLTTEEAGEALRHAKLAILPLGANEQHGPHLELRTDIAIADGFAHRLAADLGADAVLCPPLPYGLSEHHMRFPGTLTLRPATFISAVLEIAESLGEHGIRRIIVVNGHGGNIDAIHLAARQARRDHNVVMAHLMWARLASDVIRAEMGSEERYNHACQIETSIAMSLVPDMVRTDRLTPTDPASPLDPFTEPQSGVVDLPIRFDEWTHNGALGDARKASLELGERIVETAHKRALDFAREFALGKPVD